MKTIKSNSISIAIYTVVAFFFATIALQSCGTSKYNFSTSSVVPAAEGSVKIKKDKNSNYHIDLNVMRLADPKRLSPAKDTYVVWIDTENNGAKNIGQLNTSSSIISNTLKSSLKTVTPFKPVRIFITAENDGTVQYPGGQVVLNTSNF